MSFSFNNPLEIGDRNKKIQNEIGNLQDLDTTDKSSLVNALNEALDSTLNGASRNLDNLSDAGEEKLRSLNAYANKGELLTDAEGLADVKNYAHSTFDASKFTKVGSPIVTDDGIASGFGNSNYIKRNNVFNNFSTFELTVKKNNGTGVLWAGRHIPDSSYTDQNVCILNQLSSTTLRLLWRNGNGGSVIDKTWTVNASTEVYKILISNNNVYLYEDGVVNGSPTSLITANLYKGFEELFIGIVGSIGDAFTGSIDLKQFSITVDGVEVFSGNKTGIDTIKPDDYTVVGTPTISADGIASGLSNSNLINSVPTFDFNSFTKWEIHCRIKTPSTWDSTQQSWMGYSDSSDTSKQIRLYAYSSNNKITLALGWSSGTGLGSGALYSNYVLLTDTEYDIIYGADNTTQTMFLKWKKVSDSTYTSVDKTYNNKFTLTISLQCKLNNSVFVPFKGSINLNTIKLFAEGNLIYQMCLKIPYTEAGNGKGYNASTGSKVVNAIYRDRVNDMAEQFGFANYYTLSDTDFTLPQVELYGLIARQNFAPSDKYKDLTLGASGSTYTAPADGWFVINKVTGNSENQYLYFENSKTGFCYCTKVTQSSSNIRAFIPVKKNDVITCAYSASGSTEYFRFIYSVGSESEAN